MNANEDKNVARDVTAAEDELAAAVKALEDAKARLAELKEQHPASYENSDAEKAGESEGSSAEVKSDVTDESAQPQVIEVEAVAVEVEPVASATETRPSQTAAGNDEAPDWVPYTTGPAVAPAQNAAPQASASVADANPQQPAGFVPPSVSSSGSYQQPQQPYPGQTPPGYQQQAPHAGPGAVPPQQPFYGYQQQPPYYQQPYQQPAVSTKDHVAAGLLAIFLGTLGIHKFYLGYNTSGFIMLAVTIIGSIVTFGLAAGVMWIISIVEGILYLTKSQSEFEYSYVVNKREWF